MPLMDMDFAVTCQLVRHRMPQIRFLFIGSRVCSTLLSDPASRRRPCASLSLHLHQVVKGTFTPELSNMLGTLAVGMPVTRHPPHRSPRAALPHEAPILDGWRQSELGGMDGEHAAAESTGQPASASAPKSRLCFWPRWINMLRQSRITR